MWTREELKNKAKKVLERAYWKAFLVSFILLAISGGNSRFSHGGRNNRVPRGVEFSHSIKALDFETLIPIIAIGSIIGLFIFALVIVFKLFVEFPLRVGARRFFVSLTVEDAEIKKLGYAFKGERYINVVKTMFFTNLFIFLWTLLLIIPGIIKGYAYSMVPYILADNPNINYKRAIEISEKMTMGEKANIWVLDLSFIGWYLLGALACGVGILFVQPYVDVTKAELYITLRKKALQEGLFHYEELTESQ